MANTITEGRVNPFQLELRDTQVVGTIRKYLEGRAVPYNVAANTGWYKEIVAPGCFTKSIRESAAHLPLLLFHDSHSLDAIIGLAETWEERTDGLWGVWALSDAEHAQRAAQMAEQGLLGFMSIGFMPIRSETVYDDNDEATITRLEARLLETSLTPTPAFKDATVTKVRHNAIEMNPQVSGRQLDGWKSWLTDAKASAI